jgi:hypothetical protein
MKFNCIYEGSPKCVQTSIIHSIQESNAFGERVFSVMSIKWSESRNKCPQNLIKHELQITLKSSHNCKDFYELIKYGGRLLANSKRESKLSFCAS